MRKSNNMKRQQKSRGTAKSSAEPPIATGFEAPSPSSVDVEALQRELTELRRRNLELTASTDKDSSTDSMQTAFFLGIDNSPNERQSSNPPRRRINDSK